MPTPELSLYEAMTNSVEESREELALYGFTVGVDTASTEPHIWVEEDDAEGPSFETVTDFEVWASETIDAHREVTG